LRFLKRKAAAVAAFPKLITNLKNQL